MAFQIYETGSLQVTTGSGVVMDPGGLFVASDWNGATNIHPLSSSDDIYRNNGPIGENYYASGSSMHVTFGDGGIDKGILNGFDANNTGSDAGITWSWWMKSLDTSLHWYGSHVNSRDHGSSTYYTQYDVWAGGLKPVFLPPLVNAYDNEWHHIVSAYDSGSEKLYKYIDGNLIETDDSSKTNIPIPADWQITSLLLTDAIIDEFAFCHKFLTPSDFTIFGKPINLMKKKDELRLKGYVKFGDGIEQGSGSICHSLVTGAGNHSTGSLLFNINYTGDGIIGSASANLLKNSGKVVDFNV